MPKLPKWTQPSHRFDILNFYNSLDRHHPGWTIFNINYIFLCKMSLICFCASGVEVWAKRGRGKVKLNWIELFQPQTNKVSPNQLNQPIPLKRCLFLNATTGLFFPSCHLHLPQSSHLTVRRLQRILRWQRRSFQIQTIVINSFALVIVVVLFFLVTISTSFNYNTNILSHLWFNRCIRLLLVSFFLSLFLAVELSSERASAISPGLLISIIKLNASIIWNRINRF